MSLFWKPHYLTKPGVGEVMLYSRRWLPRIFYGETLKIAFRPALTGAGWYHIQPPVEPLELMAHEDAFSAMAYLRRCDPNLMPLDIRDLH